MTESALGAPGTTPVRTFINTWSARTGQRLGARVVDSALALAVVVAVTVIGPHGRPVAQDLLIVALVGGIESAMITRTGRTLGMSAFDLRIAGLGRATHPDWISAWRRSVPVALCYVVFVPGVLLVATMPFALLVSIALSPHRRGFHDRLSGTVVVQAGAPAVITDDDLATWWQPGDAAVLSPWGRIPDLFDRRRARTHRLDDVWWLAATVVAAAVVSVGVRHVPWLWLWTTLVWLVIVGTDEVWWLTRRGGTPGHLRAGYRVVDVTTGEPPTRGRAVARTAVLTPLLYVPPLQVVLALWVHASALHRGPHDLVAHTVVVEPDFVPPAFAAPPPFAVPWTGVTPPATVPPTTFFPPVPDRPFLPPPVYRPPVSRPPLPPPVPPASHAPAPESFRPPTTPGPF